MNDRPLDPEEEPLSAEVDGLLARSRRLVERSASSRQATWQQLEARLAASSERHPAARRAVAIHWSRLGLATAAVLALAQLAVGIGGGHHLRAVLPAPRALPHTPGTTPTAEAPPPSSSWPTGWQERDLGSNGQLVAAPLARFRLPEGSASTGAPYVIALDQGEVCVQVAHRDAVSQGPFVVETPLLRAIAVGTRFCVFAGGDADGSWVMVEEGRVRVERRAGEGRLVEAGGVVNLGELRGPGSPAPGVAAPPVASVPRRVRHALGRSCPSSPAAQREACLWSKTGGAGLAAQNALYLLGIEADRQRQPGRALAIWRSYLQRFPNGILSAEASFSAFEDLLEEGRFQDALAAADDLLAHHGSFVRAGEVSLRRAELLGNELGRPQEARAEYQRLLARESRDVLRDDALYGLGLCQERLRDRGAAKVTWEAYLREFPAGRHSAEVRAHQQGN
jgi:TolA-binding protein